MLTRNGLRLLVVDDHALCCAGLAMMIRTMPEVTEVAVATRAAAAVRTAQMVRPHVAVIDVTLPPADAFDTARRLLRPGRGCRILFLDVVVHYIYVRSALRVGAHGYWTKHASFDQIAEAIRRVAAGQTSFCAEVASLVVPTPAGAALRTGGNGSPLAQLTPREFEVLAHLVDGMTVKRCAIRMDLAESTVDNHKARLMRKLNVHSIVELVRLANREGILRS